MADVFYTNPIHGETKVRRTTIAAKPPRNLARLSFDRTEVSRIAETVFMLCLFAGCASLALGAIAAAFVPL
jgi:hypothetical protein